MNKEIKVYAEDSLLNLFDIINMWNKQKLETAEVSLTDLTLMMNHIEDLELELFGSDTKQEEIRR